MADLVHMSGQQTRRSKSSATMPETTPMISNTAANSKSDLRYCYATPCSSTGPTMPPFPDHRIRRHLNQGANQYEVPTSIIEKHHGNHCHSSPTGHGRPVRGIPERFDGTENDRLARLFRGRICSWTGGEPSVVHRPAYSSGGTG